MSPVNGKDHRQRLLSLIGSGESFRDAGSPALQAVEDPLPIPQVVSKIEPSPSRKAAQETSRKIQALEVIEEPPPERPEIMEPATHGLGGMQLRERRRGMRSDPAWQQKTIYLKRVTIDRAEEVARLMGIDFSVLVDYALSLQVQAETRTPELQKLLDQRRTSDGF